SPRSAMKVGGAENGDERRDVMSWSLSLRFFFPEEGLLMVGQGDGGGRLFGYPSTSARERLRFFRWARDGGPEKEKLSWPCEAVLNVKISDCEKDPETRFEVEKFGRGVTEVVKDLNTGDSICSSSSSVVVFGNANPAGMLASRCSRSSCAVVMLGLKAG